MNPLLSHYLTHIALDRQQALLAEAASARLIRQASGSRPAQRAFLPVSTFRARIASSLRAIAALLDPAPSHQPLDILTA